MLVLTALAQLMVVLDGSIITIALPRAQADLHMSDSQSQWVITAYALSFGTLLLLGGRIADYWGRRRTFLAGMLGFGIASAYGGLVQTGMELIIARGLQGAFAALMAPAALAILTTTFPSGRDRDIAFTIFGAISGAGTGIGLLLGGTLTEFLSWRWCLLVNVPIMIGVFVATLAIIAEGRTEGRHRYDLIGTAFVCFGLGSIVYGLTQTEPGKHIGLGVFLLIVGALLLAAFVISQRNVRDPLLPLRIITDPVRGGALILQLIAGCLTIGTMLYLTRHLQQVLHLAPLAAGIATLPMTLATGIVSPLCTIALTRVGPRRMLIIGPAVSGVAMLWLSRITPDGSYWVQVLPPLVLLGAAMAMVFVPVQNLALLGVSPADSGAASAANTATTQIGGSIGLSVYTALYTSFAGAHPDPAHMVMGFQAVFVATAVTLFIGAFVAYTMITDPRYRRHREFGAKHVS